MRARWMIGGGSYTSAAAAATAAALVVLVALTSGCKDARYCDESTECTDPAYPYCNLDVRECQATVGDGGVDGGRDAGSDRPRVDAQTDAPPVPDGGCEAPLRECAGSCYELDDPAHCGASCVTCEPPAHGQPTCNGTSCDFTCDAAYWRDGTTCAACDSAAHCGATCMACAGTTPDCQGGNTGQCACNATSCGTGTTPVCDPGTGACRGCAAHAECASGACGDTGACVPEAEIIYLGSPSCPTTGTGTKAQPFCTFPEALGAVTQTRYRIVATAGQFSFTGTQIVQDKKVMVIGVNSTTTPTELIQNQNNTAVLQLLQVSGTAELSLYGVTVRGGDSSGGHGIACSGSSTPAVLTILASKIGINAARGINATSLCAITIRQSVVAGNGGGGVSLTDSSHVIENSLITNNGGAGSTVGGVRIVTPGIPATFINNTVAYNTATGAAGVRCDDPATVVSSIIWGNVGTGQQSGCTVTYSDVQGEGSSGSNIDADPLFVDSGAGNYHLKITPQASPCINAGTATGAPTVDLDGKARTTAPDMGCYEAM